MEDIISLAERKYMKVWRWSSYLCIKTDIDRIYVVNFDQVKKEKFIDIKVKNNLFLGIIDKSHQISYWADVFDIIRGKFGLIGIIKDSVFTHSSQIYYKLKFHHYTAEILPQNIPRVIMINDEIVKLTGCNLVFEITLTKIQLVDIINGHFYCIGFDFTSVDNWLIAADGRRFRLVGKSPELVHLANPQEKIELQKLVPTTLPPSLIIEDPYRFTKIYEVNNIWMGRVDDRIVQELPVYSVNAGKNTKPAVN